MPFGIKIYCAVLISVVCPKTTLSQLKVQNQKFIFQPTQSISKGFKSGEVAVSKNGDQIKINRRRATDDGATGSYSNSININKSRGMLFLHGVLSADSISKNSELGIYLNAKNASGASVAFSNSLDIPILYDKTAKSISIKVPFDQKVSKVDFGLFIKGSGKVVAQKLSLSVSDGEFENKWYEEYAKRSSSDTSLVNTLANLCRVWGYLKYNNAEISEKGVNWDGVLVSSIDKIFSEKQLRNYSSNIDGIFKQIAKPQACDSCTWIFADSLLLNYDASIFSEPLLSTFSKQSLVYLRNNRRHFDNVYVKYSSANVPNPSFVGELPYGSMKLPTMEYRLLALFRYWNVINYYYPYKYLIGKNWNSVLKQLIPVFVAANTHAAYQIALLAMNAEIGDSHATFINGIAVEQLPLLLNTNHEINKVEPLPLKISSAPYIGLVTEIDSTFSARSGVMVGDVISKINDISVEDNYKLFSKFISASNTSSRHSIFDKLNLLGWATSSKNNNLINFDVVRNNKKLTKNINYNLKDFKNFFLNKFGSEKVTKMEKNAFQIINDSVLYIDPSKVDSTNSKKIMSMLPSTKAVIIDFRNYPKYNIGTILPAFINERKPGVSFQWMTMQHPGVLSNPSFQYFQSATKFTGPVRILIDENSISQSEFWSLLFRQVSFNVQLVGRRTAGADGDISSIVVPGGYRLLFSGLRVRFADGTETQKIGIVPDVKVEHTYDELINKEDIILKRALETIN